MSADFTSLQTVVRNTSGKTMFFPFLPPHGRTLEANAQARIPGNLLEWAQQFPSKARGLRYALENDLIEVVRTPAVILYDDVQNKRFALHAEGNQLGLIAPSWEQAFSDVDMPVSNA